VIFKVKTTAPTRYRVKPTLHFIPPSETKDVQVILNAKEYPQNPSLSRDSFLVQCFHQKESVNLSDLKELFQKVNPSELVPYKIRVGFQEDQTDQNSEAASPLEDLKSTSSLYSSISDFKPTKRSHPQISEPDSSSSQQQTTPTDELQNQVSALRAEKASLLQSLDEARNANVATRGDLPPPASPPSSSSSFIIYLVIAILMGLLGFLVGKNTQF